MRYPGGKSRHTSKILKFFCTTDEFESREPFLGGGSVYLAGEWTWAWINDLDPGVYNLWKMVQVEPEILISFIREITPIINHKKDTEQIENAIDLWRKIKDDKKGEQYPLGFRTLFLNKTCFSGILLGGPTGGMHQTGKYNLMSRWSEERTIRLINHAHDRLKETKITNIDWREVVKKPSDFACVFCDPPYLKKGNMCYDLAFSLDDHKSLAHTMLDCGHRFVVTIDDCSELREVWKNAGCNPECMLEEQWMYSMSDHREENREGKELFIVDEISMRLVYNKGFRTKRVLEDIFEE